MEISVSFLWHDQPVLKNSLKGGGGSKIQLQNYAMLQNLGGVSCVACWGWTAAVNPNENVIQSAHGRGEGQGS